METINRIMQIITERNIEQKQLSDYLGVQPQMITEWKAGRLKSYKKYIDKIAEFLGVSTDYLLGKDEIKNRSTSNEEVERLLKDIQDDPELTEYVTGYLNLSPENKAYMRQQLDLLNRANKSKGV